jgi:hypothetical protein
MAFEGLEVGLKLMTALLGDKLCRLHVVQLFLRPLQVFPKHLLSGYTCHHVRQASSRNVHSNAMARTVYLLLARGCPWVIVVAQLPYCPLRLLQGRCNHQPF